MGHTPGPWTAGEQDPADNTIAIRAGKLSPLAYCSPRPHWDDTQRSNAQLIAAAPDLLAALESLIEQADDPDNASNDDLVDMIDWTGIRAAIAKAKGV